jgi:hypothetical protein
VFHYFDEETDSNIIFRIFIIFFVIFWMSVQCAMTKLIPKEFISYFWGPVTSLPHKERI